MKKVISVLLTVLLVCTMAAGCDKKPKEESVKTGPMVGMVADQQQIAGDPFQYSAWKGLEKFEENYKDVEIKYLESAEEEEYLPNFDQLADEGYKMIVGVGYRLAEAEREAAGLNEDVDYVLLDYTFPEEELLDNLTGIDFEAEISAFLVGYIAANATESNQIGFVGGVSSAPIDRFEYGYRYGVAYAEKELGKKIRVEVQYADTFEEQLEGKNLAIEMYENGCDVIFQAAGETGMGVIEAAKLKDRWVIGADVDQYEEAPDNVLTSALKCVDMAVLEAASEHAEGGSTGGENILYGLGEKAVGIPEENPNLTEYYPGLYEKAMELEQQIQEGGIKVPYDKESFDELAGQF